MPEMIELATRRRESHNNHRARICKRLMLDKFFGQGKESAWKMTRNRAHTKVAHDTCEPTMRSNVLCKFPVPMTNPFEAYQRAFCGETGALMDEYRLTMLNTTTMHLMVDTYHLPVKGDPNSPVESQYACAPC